MTCAEFSLKFTIMRYLFPIYGETKMKKFDYLNTIKRLDSRITKLNTTLTKYEKFSNMYDNLVKREII